MMHHMGKYGMERLLLMLMFLMLMFLMLTVRHFHTLLRFANSEFRLTYMHTCIHGDSHLNFYR